MRQARTGRAMAKARVRVLRTFMEQLVTDVAGPDRPKFDG